MLKEANYILKRIIHRSVALLVVVLVYLATVLGALLSHQPDAIGNMTLLAALAGIIILWREPRRVRSRSKAIE